MVMRHIVILLALFCASCSSALPSLKPYQMDIQQGNVVTSKMMLQLRPGMTKSQVRFIMGTPLIQDSFHSNRWDYFYQMRHEGKVIEQRRVILEFENDALVRVRGDVIPVGEGRQDLATPATTPESLSKAAPRKEEKSLMDRLKFWKTDEKAAAAVAESAGEAAAAAAALSSAAQNAGEAQETRPEESAVPATQEMEAAAAQEVPVVPEPAPASDTVSIEPMASEPVTAPVELLADPAMTDSASAPVTQETETAAAQEAPVMPEPAPSSEAVSMEPMVREPVIAPVEPAVTDSAPAAEPSGEAMMLRFERTINLPLRDADPGNVSNPSHAPDADLPPETSPDFFERMLEKIGF